MTPPFIAGLIIGGKAYGGDAPIRVHDPATGMEIGVVAGGSAADARSAIAAARAAFPAWAATPRDERARLLLACADLLADAAPEIAVLLSREQGKPLNGLGARFEIDGAVAWARHTASLTLPVDVIQDDASGHVTVHRRPLGVVASITPWNWPVIIAIWHIAPALLAGNTVVLKPSPNTPLTTLRMAALFQRVLPPGVLNLVAGGADVGEVLATHPDVAKVAFTGSSATGRRVMSAAAATLKRLTLELGGNDAGIVLPDCDPAAIAAGLFWGAFINNGQTCGALKRLYVHNDIHDAVVEALVAFNRTVVMGNGLDEKTMLGPLQNRMQFDIVSGLVDAARADGARILTGGAAMPGPGYFYPVTLVADATDDMALVQREQFGPALPILRFRDIDDAVVRANAVEEGLGGSIWSSDVAQARMLAARLECGTCWVNAHGAIRPDVPFGGIKASGFGVEFGQYGLAEFCSLQVVSA